MAERLSIHHAPMTSDEYDRPWKLTFVDGFIDDLINVRQPLRRHPDRCWLGRWEKVVWLSSKLPTNESRDAQQEDETQKSQLFNSMIQHGPKYTIQAEKPQDEGKAERINSLTLFVPLAVFTSLVILESFVIRIASSAF